MPDFDPSTVGSGVGNEEDRNDRHRPYGPWDRQQHPQARIHAVGARAPGQLASGRVEEGGSPSPPERSDPGGGLRSGHPVRDRQSAGGSRYSGERRDLSYYNSMAE